MPTPTKVFYYYYLQRNRLYKLFFSPQVLTLLIVNVDNFPPTAFDTVFSDVGLDTMAYKPTSANLTFSEWPTLGVLIASGMRLLVFMDTQANILAVPYIIPGTYFSPRPVNFLF